VASLPVRVWSPLAAMQRTASALEVELVPTEVKARDDIATAMATVATRRVPALVAIDDGLLISNARQIAELATTEQAADDWVQASGGSRARCWNMAWIPRDFPSTRCPAAGNEPPPRTLLAALGTDVCASSLANACVGGDW